MNRNQLLRIWLGCCVEGAVRDGPSLEDAFRGDIEAIYNADEYTKVGNLRETTLKRLENKDLSEAERIAEYCENRNIQVIVPRDTLFPQRLSLAFDRPMLLYVKGNLTELNNRLCVAVVGTRKMSDYGARCAYSITYDMAKAGAVIVSGMATGVDGTAHRAALDAGGYTIAVLGNGLDRAYPAEHHFLMDEIEKNGCVISEFKPFTPPYKWNFPMRNRIISGICQATFVAEAPERSGALNTAAHALEQRRKIYAVPGRIGEGSTAGTNGLLRNGATTVSSGREIIADFSDRYATLDETKITSSPVAEIIIEQTAALRKKASTPHKAKAVPIETPNVKIDTDGLEPDEAAVMSCFSCGRTLSVDEIVASTGLAVSTVLSSLTVLEIYGRIISLPGEKYVAE